MDSEFKSCDFCRHYLRIQTGPHQWWHDCRLKQLEYPEAELCSAYQPPAHPQSNFGLGLAWDADG